MFAGRWAFNWEVRYILSGSKKLQKIEYMVNHGLYRGRGVEGGGDDITSAIGRYFFDCLVVEMFDNRFKLHSVLSMYMYSKVCYME